MTTLRESLTGCGPALVGGGSLDLRATGDAGRSGGVEFTRRPQHAVSRGRVVIAQDEAGAAYPDLSVPAQANLLLGVAAHDAAGGDELAVVSIGELRDPAWAWTPGPVFCGPGGVLTQAATASGWLRQVGVALAADRILVSLAVPASLDPGDPGDLTLLFDNRLI